jgi:hypothetical protein
MRHYNTPRKILETLEQAEIHGINAINLTVWDDTSCLQQHWKRGGKLKWIAQANPTQGDLLAQFKQGVDLGAHAIHIQGHGAEELIKENRIDDVAKIVDYVKSQGVAAGVAAHALSVIEKCEEAKIPVDFYQKTLHTREYRSAPRPEETGDLGTWDNSWCKDAAEVIEFFSVVKKPWIAFKVMAAGAIAPRRGFQHAFDGGADFVLAGMFDWQVAEDVTFAKEALGGLNRTRPWCG